jgi:hypothetical protein
MRAVVLAVVLALAAPGAHAQPAPGASLAEKRREKIKNRIRALRAARLVEELGDQVTARVLPILAKYDDEFDKLLGQRAEIERKLARAGTGDAKVVDKVIDEAVANQRAFWDSEDRRLAELRKVLTPAQVARLLVVLPPLERRIQNQLRAAIERQQQRQQPRRRGERDLDVDDDVDDTPAPPPAPVRRQPRLSPPGMTEPKCDAFGEFHGCR